MTDAAGWLSPYRVLDLTDQRGLLAGQMLAKLGADVIQVEPPGGSPARGVGPFDAAGRSLYWSAYAAGKRSVVLDLETDAGRQSLRRLARASDFLIESQPPGRMAQLGLGCEDLQTANPGLVQVSITPFGSDGPKRDYAEADLILWAAGGPLNPNRDAERRPLRISVPQAWLHAAGDAVAGALIAHFARLRTGRGQHVDISAQQSVTQATLSVIMAAAVGHPDFVTPVPKPQPKALDLSGSGARTRRSKWRLADGLLEMHLSLGPAAGARTNRLFAWMAEAGALPERFHGWDWPRLPDRIAAGELGEDDIEAAREAVAAFLATRTKPQMAEAAATRGVMLAPLNDMGDLLKSPQLKARGFLVDVQEGGETRTLPGAFAMGPQGMFAPPRGAPTVGEHSAEVLRLAAEAQRPRGYPTASGDDDRPLAGLKVVDLAWVVAGPAIGRTLADYGAQVVRVESSVRIETARMMGPFPGGVVDPQRSALYDTYNTGKLGLTLDLNRAEGQAVLRDLARWADVLIESFAPGQMDRWGLGKAGLRAANPALIGLSTSLMGQTGPHAAVAGFGGIGAAISGFQALVGQPDATPVGPFGPYTDFIAPRFALPALLAAVDHRRRTGEGCWLDVSQAEAGMQFLAPQIAQAAATGVIARAQGNRDPQFAPHGVFACAGDDRWVAIVARDDDEWARLANLIGGAAQEARFAALAGRKAHEDDVEALLGAWTAGRQAADVQAQLQALGVPAHVAADTGDMVADPQLIARGHFVRLPHPLGGESVIDASRYRLSETPAAYDRPAPHFGRDTRQVLLDILGYDAARFDELAAAGVLK